LSRKLEPVAALPSPAGTRDTILATAQRLFDEHGYDATSLREIAEAVGTTKAAVYYHFPAKEHLLLELTRPLLDALSGLATQIRDQGAKCDAEEALRSYLDLFIDHLAVLGLLARDPATQNHPDIGLRVRNLVDAIQRQVAGPDATAARNARAACAMWAIAAVSTMTPAVARTQRQTILDAAMAALASGHRRSRSGDGAP
jgi:AcrR family transcriptional regulator